MVSTPSGVGYNETLYEAAAVDAVDDHPARIAVGRVVRIGRIEVLARHDDDDVVFRRIAETKRRQRVGREAVGLGAGDRIKRRRLKQPIPLLAALDVLADHV